MKHFLFSLLACASLLMCIATLFQAISFLEEVWTAAQAPGTIYVVDVSVDVNTGKTTTLTNRQIVIGYAEQIGFYSVLPICWLWITLRNIRRPKRIITGKCTRCGYDLRATPGQCPECGTIARKGKGKKPARNDPFSNYWP